MKRMFAFFIIILIFGIQIGIQLGCGVKSRPLPPLKEPWISSGDLQKDRDKKFKSKKQIPASENPAPDTTTPKSHIEFENLTPPDEKKEF